MKQLQSITKPALLACFLLSTLSFLSGCERIAYPPSPQAVIFEDTTGRTTDILLENDIQGTSRFINPKGEVLFGGQTFYQARNFYHGYAVVAQMVGTKLYYGAIDRKGNTAIPITQPEPIRSYNGGLFQFGFTEIGYLDSTGRVVIPNVYAATHGIDDGLISLQDQAGNWGILNRQGAIVADFNYKEIGQWADGLVPVSLPQATSTKWGYLDRQGKWAIPCQYAFASNFEHGLAMVQLGKKYHLIDPQGNAVTPLEFDDYKMSAAFCKPLPNELSQTRTELHLISPQGEITVQHSGAWGTMSVESSQGKPSLYTFRPSSIPQRP